MSGSSDAEAEARRQIPTAPKASVPTMTSLLPRSSPLCQADATSLSFRKNPASATGSIPINRAPSCGNTDSAVAAGSAESGALPSISSRPISPPRIIGRRHPVESTPFGSITAHGSGTRRRARHCAEASPGCSAAQSAALTVIPGVVFSGSADGGLRGVSTKDGSIVWEFDTNRGFETVNGVKANGGSMDGPGVVVAGGMLYVSSGNGGLVGRPGNVLLAFGVDLSCRTPPVSRRRQRTRQFAIAGEQGPLTSVRRVVRGK